MARGNTRGQKRGGRNRKAQKDNTAKYVIIGIGVIVLAVVVWLLTRPSTTYDVNGYNGIVNQVLNGNTIKLQDGLTVKLLGVENTPQSQKFLQENLVNKNVTLKADSKDVNNTFDDPTTTEVWAYVMTDEATTFKNVNGSIIRLGLAKANDDHCSDSISIYRSYQNGGNKPDISIAGNSRPGAEYSDTELAKVMMPATFLVVAIGNDGRSISTGSGFFINDRGLAVSNAHVMGDSNSSYYIFFPDKEGKVSSISPDAGHKVGRLLKMGSSSTDDYCIFTVNLDQGEKVAYLPITNTAPAVGEKVAVCGNPAGDRDIYTSTFTTGKVTGLRPEKKRIQVDASMTHGNSGGPVCNFFGEVIGIATNLDTQRGQETANMNFCLDIDVVRQELDKLQSDIAQDYGGK